jgi:hypothetical protein
VTRSKLPFRLRSATVSPHGVSPVLTKTGEPNVMVLRALGLAMFGRMTICWRLPSRARSSGLSSRSMSASLIA